VFRRNLGIDQLLVRAYLSGADNQPGRMAGSATLCFTLIGLGLLAWAPWRRRPRPAAIAAAGALVSAIAIAAGFRYTGSALHLYDWGRLSSMPVPTAAALTVLAISLQCAAGRSASYEGLPPWLPVSAAMTALGLAAGVSVALLSPSSRSGLVSLEAAVNAVEATAAVLAIL